MLVKFRNAWINPAQVIHVGEFLDSDNEPLVIIRLTEKNQVEVRNKSLEEVVALINANL